MARLRTIFKVLTTWLQKPFVRQNAYDRFIGNLIRDSVENELFYVCYQPKLDLRSGRTTGAEALLRTNFKSKSFFSIADIIGLAERTGDIKAITDFVLESVKRDLDELESIDPNLQIAVNISAELISQPNYAKKLIDKLDGYGSRIMLEITETAFVHSPEVAHKNLSDLVDAGFKLSLDDYGVGYSSLEQLQRMPITELKIDRSFISNIQESHRGPLIVRSTIDMAHAMELTVVAEGVEEGTTLALLSIMGCDYVQGFYLSKPLPLHDLKAFLIDQPVAEKVQLADQPASLFELAVN